jgi:hypothetical protein
MLVKIKKRSQLLKVIVEVRVAVRTALAKIVKITKEAKMATINPVQPGSSAEHVPEFITNKPDPATGVPAEDYDQDIHDTVYQSNNMVRDGHYGGATFDGDMGRLSKIQ